MYEVSNLVISLTHFWFTFYLPHRSKSHNRYHSINPDFLNKKPRKTQIKIFYLWKKSKMQLHYRKWLRTSTPRGSVRVTLGVRISASYAVFGFNLREYSLKTRGWTRQCHKHKHRNILRNLNKLYRPVRSLIYNCQPLITSMLSTNRSSSTSYLTSSHKVCNVVNK